MCVSGDNKAKGWFLTWPQCPASPVDCFDDLKDKLQENRNLKIVEYLIAQEEHKDGNKHLHAFIKLDKRIRFNATLFDFICEGKTYHGNYQPAKSVKAVVGYCTKENNYITNLNVKALLQKQNKKLGVEELEKDALDLLDQGVISAFQLSSFVKNQNIYKLLKAKREANKYALNLDLPKQRHFWYYGPSNSGKTYKLRSMIMKEPQNWFQIPTNDDWMGYNNEKFLYIDEFKGQMSIQKLNALCDGGLKVNVKGSSTVVHPECVVYVCSNYNIKECYERVCKDKPDVIEGLYNRFNEILCVREKDAEGNNIYTEIK